MEVSLQFLHQSIRDRETSIDFHSHPMFEIVYYKSGYGTTTLHRAFHSYRPHTFAVIHPNCPHDEVRQTDTEVLYFGFSYDQSPLMLKTGFYEDSEDSVILELIEEMTSEIGARRKHFGLKVDLLLQEIVIEISRLSSGDAAEEEPLHGETERHILFAKHYIDQYFTQKISLTQLADMSGYSYDHFRHMFKLYMGQSPMHYILQLRLGKARRMMAAGEASMTRIALECGFSSLAQFSNTFKKYSGVSPSDYRQRL